VGERGAGRGRGGRGDDAALLRVRARGCAWACGCWWGLNRRSTPINNLHQTLFSIHLDGTQMILTFYFARGYRFLERLVYGVLSEVSHDESQ
jgi:hypothetical protein